MSEGQTNIWTVRHSTLTIGDFLEMLSSNGIRALADVRRFPASRRHPQFNQDELRESLAAAGIEYLHLPELGGRRQARPDSRNTVWRNPSFRGYADYMETDAFRAGVERLLLHGFVEPLLFGAPCLPERGEADQQHWNHCADRQHQ